MRSFLIALTFCILPFPAYASGIDFPVEIGYGLFLTFAATVAAMLTLPGSFLQKTSYVFIVFFVSLALGVVLGGAVSTISSRLPFHEAAAYYNWPHFFLPAACALGGFLAASCVCFSRRDGKLLEHKGTRWLAIVWVALTVLGFAMPFAVHMYFGGSGRSYPNLAFMVFPFVGLTSIVTAYVLSRWIKPDRACKMVVVVCPMACFLLSVACDVMEMWPLRNVLLFAGVFPGYPVYVILYARWRLKGKF
jgi:hypothetical protein